MKAISVFFIISFANIAFCTDIRLGTWNIENLNTISKRGFPELKGGTQLKPRTKSQLNKIAKYLNQDVNADALILTEVGAENDNSFKQLKHIMNRLNGDWQFHFGTTGGKQRLVFAYNSKKIQVKKFSS
ncbi:hypothetical protein [Agarilytica rhodophyticola]|uniref:hypothetical protein n=1 Tax=Agarilytica rhodophyticola TaxID=1737490 RepID=UPI000B349260|nr:hypothetical protein [Agarilytica rhodophyticola]